jgi:hypothetical protein
VDRESHVPYDVPVPRGVKLYVLGQFALVNRAAVAFLYASPRLSPLSLGAGAIGIALSLVSLGGLLDRRAWAPRLEAARVVAAALAVLAVL